MKVLLLLAVLFSSACCVAQVTEVQPPRLAVKWSPLHLAYFYPSMQLSVEHKLLKKINLQYEAGFVRGHRTDVVEYEDKRGFRLAAEVRYYVPSPRMVPFYVAAEYYYHDIRFDRSETVGYECTGGICDYFEYVTYRVRTVEQGPGIKFGMLMFPGWNRNRSLFFDINGGFAYRSIDYTYPMKPDAAGMRFYGEYADSLFEPNEGLSEKVRFIIGARLCYRIL